MKQLTKENNATLEEQAFYDKFVTEGISFLLDKRFKEIIIKKLKNGSCTPIQAIADTTIKLIRKIDKWRSYDCQIVFYAVSELFDVVVNIVINNNIFTVDQETINKAYSLMLEKVK